MDRKEKSFGTATEKEGVLGRSENEAFSKNTGNTQRGGVGDHNNNNYLQCHTRTKLDASRQMNQYG